MDLSLALEIGEGKCIVRVPLIYALHSGNLYGTERMALATVEGLRDCFEPTVFAPPGKALEAAATMGVSTRSFSSPLQFAFRLRPFLARHEKLAAEYSNILMSYVRPRQNFLEHEVLQRGVLWGIGRLAGARPERLTGLDADIMPFLDSADAVHRGYAALALGNLKSDGAAALLQRLADDFSALTFYDAHRFLLTRTTVAALARMALSQILQI